MVTVFVVDDEPVLHEIYYRMLSYNGDSVIAHAYDGEEAVNRYKQMNPKPDIILMDYRMPVKNGIEATEKILQVDANAKIVFVSADIAVKKAAIATGACSFIAKTFTREELLTCIEHIVQEKRKTESEI